MRSATNPKMLALNLHEVKHASGSQALCGKCVGQQSPEPGYEVGFENRLERPLRGCKP